MLTIGSFASSRSDLKPEPIAADWILEGAPVARSAPLLHAPDGKVITGLWDCTAGKFRWNYWYDEIVHVLEGEVRVTDAAQTLVLVPGSVAYFPSRLETVWEVPSYVKKMFVLAEPRQSRVRRVASAVRRRVLSLAGR